MLPVQYQIQSDHLNRVIEAIKAIRYLTGLGLPEAKRLTDAIREGKTVTITLLESPRSSSFYQTMDEALTELKRVGCVLTQLDTVDDEIVAKLREVAELALEGKRYGVLNPIVALLEELDN